MPEPIPFAPRSPALTVEDLHKSFGSRSVLRGMSFSVLPGEIYGLLGPNGSGKTTMIHVVCGLLSADAGTVRLAGGSHGEDPRHRLGVAPQEVSLYQDLTCEENLHFFGRLYGLRGEARAARVEHLIGLFDLGEYRRTSVSKLSGGWARRTNVAAALVHAPPLVFLDEPTAGLDVDSRHALWELIESLAGAGTAIVLTTHELEEAERLCSRIGILQEGTIAAEGTLDELRSLVPAKLLAEVETDGAETVRRRAEELGWACRIYRGRLTLLLPETLSLGAVVERLGDGRLTTVSLRPVGLRQVYQEVVHGGGLTSGPARHERTRPAASLTGADGP